MIMAEEKEKMIKESGEEIDKTGAKPSPEPPRPREKNDEKQTDKLKK